MAGETVDIDDGAGPGLSEHAVHSLLSDAIIENIDFYSAADVEAAISRSELNRPQITVNGKVIWRWPEPAPKGMMGPG